MEEILSIRIKGDTSELETGSSRSVVSLDTLASSLSKTETRINSFSSALKAYGANAGVVQQSARQISSALQQMAKTGNVKVEPILSLDKLKLPNVTFPPIVINAKADTSDIANQALKALTQGLTQAEAAFDKFAQGKVSIGEVTDAIERLSAAKQSLGDTAPIDRILAALNTLSDQSRGISIPVQVNAAVDISAALAEIEKIKDSIPVEQVTFWVDSNIENLITALNGAETALQKLRAGEGTLSDVNAAIELLNANKSALGDTASIDKLVAKLANIASPPPVEVSILPKADVQAAQTEITKVRTAIPRDPLLITLTADSDGFRQSLLTANQATQQSVKQINDYLSSIQSGKIVVEGLDNLERVIRDFQQGTGSAEALTAAFNQLNQAKQAFGDTTLLDNLLATLNKLQHDVQNVSVPVTLEATTDVSDVLSEIANFRKSLPAQTVQMNVDSNLSGFAATLNEATAALQKFEAGKGNVEDVSASLQKLLQLKGSLGDTSSIDKIIATLQKLEQEAQTVTIPANISAKVNVAEALADIKNLRASLQAEAQNVIVPVKANVEGFRNQLQEAAEPVQLRIDTTQATALIQQLSQHVTDLRAQIEEKKTALTLLTDTGSVDAAKKDIASLEAELTRLQTQLAAVKPLSVAVNVDANTEAATQKLQTLLTAVADLQAEISRRKNGLSIETDTSKIAAGEADIQRLEAELKSLQAQINALPPVVVPVEVGEVTLPTVTPQPVKVPVVADKLEIDRPAIPAIVLPVDADTSSLTKKLNAASQAVQVSIDTVNAQAQVEALEGRIKILQEEISSRKMNLPLVADTEAAQQEIRDLESELSKLQSGLSAIKPVNIPVQVEKIDLPTQAPKVILPVEANLSTVQQQLAEVAKPINLKVDTDEAAARVQRISASIEALKAEISEKQAALPLLTDTTQIAAAQKEIQGLESEVARLQNRLASVKPLAVAVSIDTDTQTATENVTRLLGAVRNLENEIAARKEVIAVETDTTKLAQAQTAVKILEEELTKLQAQINAINPVVKLAGQVEKVSVPVVAPTVVKVTAEVEKLTLPPVPVEPIEIPVDGNLAPIRAKLDDIAKPVSLHINADEATAELKQLSATIETLQGKLGARKEAILIETDPQKLAQTNREIEHLEKEITRLKNIGKSGFDEMGRRVDKFGNSLEAFSKKNGAATENLVNFSRILQDIPYGIQGVGNNLNPMLESLQRASAASGGLGAALKGMAGAMIGPAGIGVAIAAASSLLIGFGDKIFGAGEQAKTASEEFLSLTNNFKSANDALAGASSEYERAFSAIHELRMEIDLAKKGFIDKNDVVKQYNDTVGKTIGKLQTLDEVERRLATAGDAYIKFTLLKAAANLALQKAADAALQAEIKASATPLEQKKSLSFWERINLPFENAPSFKSQVQKAIKPQIDALKTQETSMEAIAKKFEDDAAAIAKAFNFRFLGEDIKTPKGKADVKSQFEFFFKEFDQLPDVLLEKVKNLSETDINLTPLQTRLFAELRKMAETARDFASKNFHLFEGLGDVLSAGSSKEIVAAGAKFWNDVKAGLVRLKPQKIDAGALTVSIPEIKVSLPGNVQNIFHDAFKDSQGYSTLTPDPLNIEISLDKQQILNDFKLQFRQLGQELPKTIGVLDPITGIEQRVDVKSIINTGDLTKGLQAAKDKAVQQIKDLNAAITAAAQGIGIKVFSTIGEGLGAALTGGGIKEAFAGLGSFIGEAIQKLGEQMIALSPIITAIQAAIKSFSPALLLPAGIALTALGAVIKNMFAGALPGHRDGLGYVPYDDYVARLHRGEMVLTAEQAAMYRRAVDAARFSSSSAVPAPNFPSFGSMTAAPVLINTRLRGRDMVLQQAREAKAQRRGG